MSVDEALEIREQVAELMQDSQLQQAIDILDDAVERAGHEPALALEMKIELASTLFIADEFSRAAGVLDAILPTLAGRDDAPLLRYYAGISHAEIGDVEQAIGYLTDFVAGAEPLDPLYRDAAYQLGMMLPAVGRVQEGLERLEALRPLLTADYGADSIHVHTLDRRIAQVRRGLISST